MATSSIGNMTRLELREFVEEIVDERLKPDQPTSYQQAAKRPISEVLEEMEQLLFVPKPGTPSVVELLREDRDR